MRPWDGNHRARLMCGAAFISSMLIAAPASAQAQSIDFNIPAQSLSAALDSFAAQSRQPLLVAPEMTAGKNSQGVTGLADSSEALSRLLAGTGLGYRVSGKTFLIVDASDPQSGSAAGDGADQGTVQALIVTAQKREENIQDVPIAMSAFTQEDLTRSQVAGGPDLMTQVPNFTFTKTNFSGYSIQIRGIGTQAISATTDAAVAVAFNNTPFIRNRFFEQEFYDLERVEVLRGPQGTLYGRNATAGVVNIISAKPKNHFEAKLSGDVSNYNSTRLEGMINLPLVEDKAALRIAGAWTKRDGYVKNILTGQQTDGRDLWSTRVTLQLTPTDNFKANLIWERFSENDDRLRSGKQLCMKDLGPSEVNGLPYNQNSGAFDTFQLSQGCKPSSLYSPDSFQTPNGYALPYYGPTGELSGAVYQQLDPYLHSAQSRDLREIETHIKPEYEASNDTVELQLQFDLPHELTLVSETGFNRDHIFSFEDYNRFDTTPGVFVPGAGGGHAVQPDGVFCDPQLGCTDRLAAGDLSTAKSRQFSQEFRVSSNFDGPFNFNLGANFLRYDTEDKYYVFVNSLTLAALARWYHTPSPPYVPGVSDNSDCFGTIKWGIPDDLQMYNWADPNRQYSIQRCMYIDPNNIHNLNDEGRNYFLSKNPYHLISYAAFGEAYYNITDKLKITAGLRWTIDRKTAPIIPSWLLTPNTWGFATSKVINLEWREPTGRLALDWKPTLSLTDETLLYASYVRGYKAGGANPPTAVHNAEGGIQSAIHPDTFKPEFVNAYEVGTKNTLLDGKLTFNLSSFYYDYTGYQISQIVDRSALNMNFDAKIWGAELESDWRPVENLRLGLKVGYEHTRVADGSRAIDTMDRTAGDPNYIVLRPFPTVPSNCIVPVWFATWNNRFQINDHTCEAFQQHVDPATWLPYTPNPTVASERGGGPSHPIDTTIWGTNYPGFNPDDPYINNGEGIFKDLSGNSLPNAPHITATVTADYTLPLPSNWLMTLHTDLYYQSEAWTRIFNTPGYDKLKAYNNINVAAIFANEDAGWQVMAYVKNVLNKDNITGSFLNSDDTGLTTNVFLNEPRLYGLRVTKEWTGSEWWSAHAHQGSSAWYPYRVELDGYYGPFGNKHEVFGAQMVPIIGLYTPDFPYPFKPQKDLDWGAGGGVKFTYQPEAHGWNVSAAIRYGRAAGDALAHTKKSLPSFCVLEGYTPNSCTYSPIYPSIPNYLTGLGLVDQTDTTAKNYESHAIADFMVGKNVGLGGLGRGEAVSNFSLGVSYGHFKSMSTAVLHGMPDLYFPPYVITTSNGFEVHPSHMHWFSAQFTEDREFKGAGPSLAWDGSLPLLGDADKSGRLDVDLGLGAGLLFGKQKTLVRAHVHGEYGGGIIYPVKYEMTPTYDTTLDIPARNKSVSVPTLRANLGLSYTLGGVKVSGGYRIERYYKVFDAGIESRKTYDRSFDGAYAKVSIGFGG